MKESLSITQTLYLDGYQYVNGNLEFSPVAGAYVKKTENIGATKRWYDYVFNYTDHLGNIRLSYTLDYNTNKLKILEENHYYPFGLKHRKYNNLLSDIKFKPNISNRGLMPIVKGKTYKYKYNGKELQDELGLNVYDYGARNYDASLGRWMNVDPLADDPVQVDKSPYAFAWNNPIMYVDPTGLKPETIYENMNTGETVEVNDGIDKTIKVNDSQFQEAKFFANEINPTLDENGLVTIGVSKGIADGYNEFYNSVNSYDGFSLANLYDYAFVEPELNVVGEPVGASGGLELIGGPAGQGLKNGGSYLAKLLCKKLSIQTHHIIPKAIFKKNKALLKPFMKLNGGFNPKKLPTPFHGNHPQYNKYVGNKIQQLINSNNLNAGSLKSLQKSLNSQLNKAYDSGVKLNDYFRKLNN